MTDETSIDVSKKSVADLLGSGSKSRFLIPEYQRPYAWGAGSDQHLVRRSN